MFGGSQAGIKTTPLFAFTRTFSYSLVLSASGT
jgi:hypothetical protein